MEDKPLKFTEEQQEAIMQARLEDEHRHRALVGIGLQFKDLLRALQNVKPRERSEEARRFAVTITELEKVSAYYTLYIENGN